LFNDLISSARAKKRAANAIGKLWIFSALAHYAFGIRKWDLVYLAQVSSAHLSYGDKTSRLVSGLLPTA